MNLRTPLFRFALLDQCRGLAALLVLGFHSLWAIDMGGWSVQNQFLLPLRWIFANGWVGVHLFFVISGYCIAASALRCIVSGYSAGSFLRDRMLRVYPPYWGALAFSCGLSIALAPFSNVGAVGLPQDFLSLMTNATLTYPYLHGSPIMIVSWTLVVETGFYILVAAGVAIWHVTKSGVLCLVVGVCFTLASLYPLPQPHFQVLRFWPEFVCGGLVFIIHAAESQTIRFKCRSVLIVLTGIGAALQTVGPSTLWIAGVFALLLVIISPFDDRLARLPALRWLGFVGLLSYSIYLIHAPIIVRVANFGRRFIEGTSAGVLALTVAMWCSSLAGAFFFYRWIESPYERWRHSIFRRRVSLRNKSLPLAR